MKLLNLLVENNPKDVIQTDVPLFIRLLEYAREEAKTDMELHNIADAVVKRSSMVGKVVTMEDYEYITSYGKEDMEETIKKQGDKYVVYPEKGNKKLGTHSTKKAAEKQLTAIHIQQHKNK